MASTLSPQKLSDYKQSDSIQQKGTHAQGLHSQGAQSASRLKAPPKPSFAAQSKTSKSKSLPQKALILSSITFAFLVLYFIISWANRPVAQTFTVRQGTAISAVYGTVHIEYGFQQIVRAEMPGYIDLGPNLRSGITSVGILIRKGQILGNIRDQNTIRQTKQAQTELDAMLAKLQQGPPSLDLLKSAQERLIRLQKSGNGVSEGERTTGRATVNQLSVQVENEKTELQRQVDNAASTLKYWKEQTKRSEVRSPIEGYLIAAPPVDHQMVLQNEILFTIASRDLYISGLVNEEDVGSLHVGMKAQLKLYAYGSQEFTSTLCSVLPSADTTNQRYTVTLSLDNPPDNLRAALTGEMNILVGKHENVLVIPGRALRDPDERLQDRVYIVRHGIIHPRTVKIGYRNPEYVEILEGLQKGDQVIVADQDTFSIGERVRALEIDDHKSKKK